jgi:GT2 family glycosyltransferase
VIGSTVDKLSCGDQRKADSDARGTVRLSILLVNFNGARHLAACLESICRFAPPDTQVILEDNASTDGSIEAAEKNFPWLQILRSDRNRGFAAGNNFAGRNASGRFLLLLNTDTLLLEPISPVVDWLEKHRAYGALTIKMLDGNRVIHPCTGRFPSAFRLALLGKMLVPLEKYGASEAYDVDWVQGSFLLIRADVWQMLNGLDERSFMYGEDVDLCKRVWDSGYRCAYLPHQKYLHWGGYDVSRFPDQICGLANYVERHMAGPQRLLCFTVLFGGCLFRTAAFFGIGIFLHREINNIKAKASWRAFRALMSRRA